jgi:hypothetical protein
VEAPAAVRAAVRQAAAQAAVAIRVN